MELSPQDDGYEANKCTLLTIGVAHLSTLPWARMDMSEDDSQGVAIEGSVGVVVQDGALNRRLRTKKDTTVRCRCILFVLGVVVEWSASGYGDGCIETEQVLYDAQDEH